MNIKEFLRVNWFKTIYFNFKILPIHIAIKFPILLYGNIKLTSLKGKIEFNAPIKSFMCKFGRNVEIITLKSKSELRLDGTLIIDGSFMFGNDFIVHIMKNAELKIGSDSYFGRKTLIVCTKNISIGKQMRFGYESQIIDSNFHYSVDLENLTSHQFNNNIEFGDYIWVGNRSTIMSGTRTNNFLIVGSNSLLNKDYTKFIPEFSLVAGTPAKLVRKNITRIYNSKFEAQLNKRFRENGTEILNIPKEFDLTKEEILNLIQ